MKLTFLGTGGSLGVPVIGCSCPVCTSTDPRNNRTRPSVLLEYDGKTVLIDTSPDFRLQALRAGLVDLDAVIFTHAHADHILGIDDLRIIGEHKRAQIPVFGSAHTLERLRTMFSYAFEQSIWRTDIRRLGPVAVTGPFELFGRRVTPIPVLHEDLEVFGYRFGDFAYLTDVSLVSESSMALLAGCKLLVISALRKRPHVKHLSLDEVVDLIKRLKPERALLTHISHELEHRELIGYLPDSIEPAFDGMVIET